MRMRLTIAMATLRYKRTAEIADSKGVYHDTASGFGRCEAISPTIPQKN